MRIRDLLITILAYLRMIAIPVAVFTGAVNPNYIGTWGLAGAWIALLLTAVCVSGEAGTD